MMFFDAHLHRRAKEAGGFLIGLEGTPKVAGTLSNTEALQQHDPANRYIAFYYVTKENLGTVSAHLFLKFHPRRERYSPEEVIESIRLNQPVAVMLDTLNEPAWVAYDYWKIARTFPDVIFLFPHAGGYLVNEFLKICHFQSNVWIDFALTHTMLGHYGQKPEGLPYIHEAIVYALHAPFAGRVLLSSDYPFFAQDEMVEYYRELGAIEALNANFTALFKQLQERG